MAKNATELRYRDTSRGVERYSKIFCASPVELRFLLKAIVGRALRHRLGDRPARQVSGYGNKAGLSGTLAKISAESSCTTLNCEIGTVFFYRGGSQSSILRTDIELSIRRSN